MFGIPTQIPNPDHVQKDKGREGEEGQRREDLDDRLTTDGIDQRGEVLWLRIAGKCRVKAAAKVENFTEV